LDGTPVADQEATAARSPLQTVRATEVVCPLIYSRIDNRYLALFHQ
jgi:hypothetical protein